MRTKGLAIALLCACLAGQPVPAAEGIKEALQKGLYEEEANRNLDAAIAAYQSVLTQFADQRQMAATAVFRLGECYRKQGKNTEAAAQYERIVKEFSDQTVLANLSRANLTALGVTVPATAEASAASAATDKEAKEIQRIKAMIQNSPDLINGQTRQLGTTVPPLHSAARGGQLAVVGFLLDQKADVNIRDNTGETPLHEAASAGNRAMVELLLKRGADVNASTTIRRLDTNPSWSPTRGSTALHFAAENDYLAVAEVLVTHGADVNATKADGSTALHYAALNGNTAMVKLLLAHKADVNSQGFTVKEANRNPRVDRAITPLHLAAREGRRDVAELLLAAGAKVDARNQEGQTALNIAAGKGDLAVVELLLARKADPNAKDSFNVSALLRAVLAKSATVVKALLNAGADVNAVGPDGQTLLLQASAAGNKEVVELLLSNKADPNLPDRHKVSPLFSALGSKDLTLVKLLLQAGANPNQDGPAPGSMFLAKNNGMWTPLCHAVAATNCEMAELLLQHGADVSVTNEAGYSPLHGAVTYRDKTMVELLLANKANPNAVAKDGETPLSLARKALERAQPRQLTTPALPGRPLVPIPLLVPGRPGRTIPSPYSPPLAERDVQALQEIADLLLKHGADPYLQRRLVIAVSRKAANYSEDVFRKDHGGHNRYTLLELIAWKYSSGTWSPPFPNLADISINRLTGAKATREIKVNLESLLKTGEYDTIPWLEWGDVVEIPEADHLVAANWQGFETEIVEAIGKGTERQMQVIAGDQSKQHSSAFSVPEHLIGPGVPTRRRTVSAKLSDVVTDSRMVRTSSDVSRVVVKRKEAGTGKLLELPFDLSKPLGHDDLWLRDGDVIVIPDKQ